MGYFSNVINGYFELGWPGMNMIQPERKLGSTVMFYPFFHPFQMLEILKVLSLNLI